MTLVLLYTDLTPMRGEDHSGDFRLVTTGLDVSTRAVDVQHVYFDRNEGDTSAPIDLNLILPDAINLPVFMAAYAAGQTFTLSLLIDRKSGTGHSAMLEIDSDAAKIVSVFFEDDDSDDNGSLNLTLRMTAGTIHSFEPDPASPRRPKTVASYPFG